MTVLVTNNSNTHPPEAWAYATAKQIFDLDADYSGPHKLEGMKFQIMLAEALTLHHAHVQEVEQAALDSDICRLCAPHDAENFVDEAISAVQAVAAGTPWAAQFVDPAMVEQIRMIVGSHFQTAQHIHRTAHAVATSHLAESQAFLAGMEG